MTEDINTLTANTPLLTRFLQQLTVARRQLSFYPPEHPKVAAGETRAFNTLAELFQFTEDIVLGIAPDALLFEQVWLDRQDPAHSAFADFFSALGVASVSFRKGLSEAELRRFNQLLGDTPDRIEAGGGLEKLLRERQIRHIEIVPVDYDAFQGGRNPLQRQQNLWEAFLNGLRDGELEEAGTAADLTTIADIANQHFSDRSGSGEAGRALEGFIENRILQQDGGHRLSGADRRFNALLQQLTPEALDGLFGTMFNVLDRHRDAAPGILKKIPPHLLQDVLARKARSHDPVSSRLVALVDGLSKGYSPDAHRTVLSHASPLTSGTVRTRLNTLFSEERQDLYMPGSYRTALGIMLENDIRSAIPQETRRHLKSQLETVAVEVNLVSILFELLNSSLDKAREHSVQLNLINLARYFLDSGDFLHLRRIHENWSAYLYSGRSTVSIFEEQVLTNQTQTSFMSEVIDGFEIWDEANHQEIIDYIATVGEPYCELVIEQLGLASTWEERKRWMRILERIGGDAQGKILKALADERWYLVRNLLAVLRSQPAPGNLRSIHNLCLHDHPKVRAEAIRTLFSCNPATANRQLLKELQSHDFEARLAALQVADGSRDRTVLERLHNLVLSESSSDRRLQEQREAVRALTRIGNGDSLPIFNRVIRKQPLLVNRRVKKLQKEIIRNLARFPDDRARKLLQEHCSGKFKKLARSVLEKTS